MTERTCQCGQPYTDDASGRWRHKFVLGHPPTPQKDVSVWEKARRLEREATS